MNNQQPPLEFQRVPKADCKHCLGRGWERYLVARVLNTDGSIAEQFEAVDCRCVKLVPAYKEIQPETARP